MFIIPAIDIIDGKCVRLTKGDYAQKKIYNENPLEVAKQFQDAGLHNLHLVDLDGAKSKHIVNWKIIEKICSKTTLKVDVGGGIKSDEDARMVFECGARQITAGSIAVKEPEKVIKWIENFGAEKIILGADVIQEKIAITGWTEKSEKDIYNFISEYLLSGIQYCICTDISKDGMLQGPSVKLYEKILEKNPMLKLIASGGVSSINDLQLLKEKGLFAAIVGKAIYENKISLKELSLFL